MAGKQRVVMKDNESFRFLLKAFGPEEFEKARSKAPPPLVAASSSPSPSCTPTSTRLALDPEPSQGADSNYTFSPEPTDHAIGRSRGGLTTKVHALTDELCSLQTVQLSAGQAGDNPMLWPLLDLYRATTRDQFRLRDDTAYSHNSTRAQLRKMKINHTIPERSDQIGWRKAKGSTGGRPPTFDPRLYCHRNTVERGFRRLKHWRATEPLERTGCLSGLARRRPATRRQFAPAI